MSTFTKTITAYIIFLACCFLLLIQISYAQLDNATGTQNGISYEEYEKIKNPIEQKLTPSERKTLSELNETRIINLAANISNRLEVTRTRLDTIAYRMNTRIKKMESAGLDMSDSKSKLEEAREHMSLAQKQLDTVDAQVTATVTSEKPQEAWPAVRKKLMEIHAHLIASKQALKETLAAMKQAQPTQTPEVSSSTSATASTSIDN